MCDSANTGCFFSRSAKVQSDTKNFIQLYVTFLTLRTVLDLYVHLVRQKKNQREMSIKKKMK